MCLLKENSHSFSVTDSETEKSVMWKFLIAMEETISIAMVKWLFHHFQFWAQNSLDLSLTDGKHHGCQ